VPLGHAEAAKIEIFSATIDGFGYADCPDTRTWLEAAEWLGAPSPSGFPLHLNRQQSDVASAQPARRRRVTAGPRKVRGRRAESACTLPTGARGVRRRRRRPRVQRPGELAWPARREQRGPAAASFRLSTRLYDPHSSGRPRGDVRPRNPNVLTFDRDLALAQACSGQHALVQVERWTGPALPPIRATIHRRWSGDRSRSGSHCLLGAEVPRAISS